MFKFRRFYCGLLLVMISSLNVCTAASDQPGAYVGGQWWVNAGIGAGNGSALGGPTVLLEGNYRLAEYQLISLRATQTSDIQIFRSSDEFNEIGLLYGLIGKGKYGYASVSAGIGVAQCKKYYNESWFSIYPNAEYTTRQTTVNIPLEIQLFATPTPYVGIGLIGFSNINNVTVLSGVALALQFGNLW